MYVLNMYIYCIVNNISNIYTIYIYVRYVYIYMCVCYVYMYMCIHTYMYIYMYICTFGYDMYAVAGYHGCCDDPRFVRICDVWGV